MAIETLPTTAPLKAGERLAGLNHVAELRARFWGDSWKEVVRFVDDMRDKRDPQSEENNRALAAIFFLAKIPAARHELELSELTTDEKKALITAMNHFRAVVSLFPKRLIKPSMVRMPNRKRSSAVYLGGCLALGVIGSILWPTEKSQPVAKTDVPEVKVEPTTPTFEYADKTLKEYRNEPKETRHDIVKGYVGFKGVPVSSADAFYACMSEYTFTKDDALKLGDVLGWCFNDFEKDPQSLNNKINLDAFQGNFSGWDGSYRPLEKLIKASMNDDSSYKHVSTVYHLILNKDPHAVVKTTFRGTNAYGGVVKQTIAARVNVKTGEIVSMLNN